MLALASLLSWALFAADLTSPYLLDIIWGNTQAPSQQQLQLFRQNFSQSLLTPQEALTKVIRIAKAALSEYHADIARLSPYMQNLGQVCQDISSLFSEIARLDRNKDYSLLQEEYQDALLSPDFASIFGIHIVLYTTDMFFLYKAFLEHPQTNQINQTLKRLGYSSTPSKILQVNSKEDLKHFLLTITKPTLQNNQGRNFLTSPVCPPDQFNVLFGFMNEFEPSPDVHPHQLALSCALAHHSHLSMRYIFTNNGLFSMISDPVAVENDAHLISLPTTISATSYALWTHQTATGLASRHIHDYVHFAIRHGFFSTFDMIFEPTSQPNQKASSLLSQKILDYVEGVILTDTSMLHDLHILKMFYIFSVSHESHGMPTLMCSVLKSLQKMCLHWTLPDPDFQGLVNLALQKLDQHTPMLSLTKIWSEEGNSLAHFLAPHFKFKTLSEKTALSGPDVLQSLPKTTLHNTHKYLGKTPAGKPTSLPATISPTPFTVYFEKSKTPFSYLVQDGLHKTLVLCSPSLSEVNGTHHQHFLEVLAHILGEDLKEYCCPQQYYQVYSTNYAYAFAFDLYHLQPLLPTQSSPKFCTTPHLQTAFCDITCTCPTRKPFRKSGGCFGGSLLA